MRFYCSRRPFMCSTWSLTTRRFYRNRSAGESSAIRGNQLLKNLYKKDTIRIPFIFYYYHLVFPRFLLPFFVFCASLVFPSSSFSFSVPPRFPRFLLPLFSFSLPRFPRFLLPLLVFFASLVNPVFFHFFRFLCLPRFPVFFSHYSRFLCFPRFSSFRFLCLPRFPRFLPLSFRFLCLPRFSRFLLRLFSFSVPPSFPVFFSHFSFSVPPSFPPFFFVFCASLVNPVFFSHFSRFLCHSWFAVRALTRKVVGVRGGKLFIC